MKYYISISVDLEKNLSISLYWGNTEIQEL